MKALTLAVALTLAASAAPAQDFHFRRELATGTRFAVRNIIGDVRVEAGTGREVEVTARKKPGRHGDPEDVEIKAVEMTGGVAICVFYPNQRDSRSDRNRDDERAERRRRREDAEDDDDDRPARRRSREPDPCHRDSDWNGNNRNDTSVDIVVRLPAGVRADLKTVSGDVSAEGIRGTLEIASVSGDVHLADFQGDVLDATTVSGDVDLARVTAREVTAETVSGEVSFSGPLDPKGAYDFKTLSGDVTLTLPREPDARMSAVTFSGDVRSDFPVQSRDRRHRNRFQATWGSGTAQLDLESFSGDIKIRSGR